MTSDVRFESDCTSEVELWCGCPTPMEIERRGGIVNERIDPAQSVRKMFPLDSSSPESS